ncbi:hypothetical protein DFS33DRAFT_969911 [Desarmillaria ectypa]|nr:hypothetical protein DFS33DRAFT_969911 [Desarmillaria ectypa]
MAVFALIFSRITNVYNVFNNETNIASSPDYLSSSVFEQTQFEEFHKYQLSREALIKRPYTHIFLSSSDLHNPPSDAIICQKIHSGFVPIHWHSKQYLSTMCIHITQTANPVPSSIIGTCLHPRRFPVHSPRRKLKNKHKPPSQLPENESHRDAITRSRRPARNITPPPPNLASIRCLAPHVALTQIKKILRHGIKKSVGLESRRFPHSHFALGLPSEQLPMGLDQEYDIAGILLRLLITLPLDIILLVLGVGGRLDGWIVGGYSVLPRRSTQLTERTHPSANQQDQCPFSSQQLPRPSGTSSFVSFTFPQYIPLLRHIKKISST